jgi:N-acetylneuraminic acid mutarotase
MPTSTTNAPSARYGHTAVWTGTEMIVWGGTNPAFPEDGTSTGGRYDPATDSWKPTSMTRVAGPRLDHTAVWTGTQMIVWGGMEYLTYLNTGGRYDPVTDSWRSTDTANAPSPRWGYSPVWTGAEMIVWGGSMGLTSTRAGATIRQPTAGGQPIQPMRRVRYGVTRLSGPALK